MADSSDKRLQELANTLMMNSKHVDEIGLLQGKLGIIIFLFYYSRFTGIAQYEDYAGDLIDEVYDNLSAKTLLDFENGLMGIGWGIEYLSQNGFVEVDTDEALIEIDKIIWKSDIDIPFILENNKKIFGHGLYFLQRTKVNRFNFLSNKQFETRLLTDACEKLLERDQYPNPDTHYVTLPMMNSIIYFVAKCCFRNEGELIRNLVLRCQLVMDNFFLHSNDLAEFAFLREQLVNLLLITPHDMRPLLDKQIKGIEQKIKENSLDDNMLMDCFTRNVWHKLLFSDPHESHIQRFNYADVKRVVNEKNYWFKRLDDLHGLNMGLSGLAGLGLGMVFEEMKRT